MKMEFHVPFVIPLPVFRVPLEEAISLSSRGLLLSCNLSVSWVEKLEHSGLDVAFEIG